jgi:cysteine desulfurase/selenocysteine lyase
VDTLEKKFLKVRADFPRLKSSAPFIYLDSAATTQKPEVVISTLASFYRNTYGTVHRAVYSAAQEATRLYDEARGSIAWFINAAGPVEVIFTRGATDSLNIVAESLTQVPKSKILISEMEHHANIVPWQLAAERTGAAIQVLPVTQEGAISLDLLKKALSRDHFDVVSITHGSNILGTITPIKEIAELVHGAGALLVVDGAQTAGHMPIDVQALGCDFFCFSSHKMCGPTSVGVLWGKKALLERLPPTRGGGDMIDQVTFEKTTWNDLPLKFEPGTPPIAEAIGFGAAIEYLRSLGMDSIQAWEQELFRYFLEKSKAIPELHLVGTCAERCPLQSFYIKGIHPLDLATFLDLKGIAVRSGTLCGQPILKKYGLTELTRASFAFYNTKEEIDIFCEALTRSVSVLL